MMDRRRFITGITGLIAAPAVVPFASLMPIRGIVMPVGTVLPVGQVLLPAIFDVLARQRMIPQPTHLMMTFGQTMMEFGNSVRFLERAEWV